MEYPEEVEGPRGREGQGSPYLHSQRCLSLKTTIINICPKCRETKEI